MPRVLLAGASGYIGRAAARELSSAGYAVVCPLRPATAARARPELETLPGCEVVAADLGDSEALAGALGPKPVDAIVSCIASRSGAPKDAWAVDHDANLHLLNWALGAGVEHFTLLSAICVQKPKLQFQFAKRRFEETLANSGMRYSIVRPTAFFKSLCGQVERVAAGKPYLLFGNGELTACKPISESDLARYLRLTLERHDLQQRVLPIGGPGPALTPIAQGKLLADLAGRPFRYRALSPRWFERAATVLDGTGTLLPALRDKAEFARTGHYYATESMLLWDGERLCYDAEATPEFGEERLEDCYRRVLSGDAAQDLGAHRLFSRPRQRR